MNKKTRQMVLMGFFSSIGHRTEQYLEAFYRLYCGAASSSGGVDCCDVESEHEYRFAVHEDFSSFAAGVKLHKKKREEVLKELNQRRLNTLVFLDIMAKAVEELEYKAPSNAEIEQKVKRRLKRIQKDQA